MSVVERMGEYTPVECFHAGRDSVKKGMPKLTQQIIVGTPGTIIDVSSDHSQLPPTVDTELTSFLPFSQMVVKSRVLDLSAVKVFVLDEADNMLASGTMGEQSIQVKKCVRTVKPSRSS